jgi:glycosyltransferase involved in cell wall biosynthesis
MIRRGSRAQSRQGLFQNTTSLGREAQMREKTSISVAMATFNGGAFVAQQLASIDAQLLLPDEIVISDDCSDDDTLRIVADAAGAGRVPHRVQSNTSRSGVIENFSKAFNACAGDTYCYCDQDDVWDRRRVAILMRALDAPGVTLAFHPSRLMSADLATCNGISPTGISPGVYKHPLPGGRLWGYGHQMMFRSTVWTLVERILKSGVSPKPEFAGNFDILLIAAAGLLGHVAYVSEPLVDFRRHGGSTSPAGKATARDESLMARLERQRLQVEQQLVSLSSWSAYLQHPECARMLDGLVADPAAQSARYLREVRAHEAILRHRLRIYERRGALGRLAALARAAASGAYGSVYQGKLPAKLVMSDMAAAFLSKSGPA